MTCIKRCSITLILLAWLIPIHAQDIPPTLEDFWNGDAEWVMDIEDVGLPIGESDTVAMGDDVYWSYLHASDQSAGSSKMPKNFVNAKSAAA